MHADARAARRLAKRRALRAGAAEAIFIRDGHVTDCTASNLFFVVRGEVRTPPESNYILSGITREAVLDLCRQEGIPCAEVGVLDTDLPRVDKAYLTGTSDEITPVVRIDGPSSAMASRVRSSPPSTMRTSCARLVRASPRVAFATARTSSTVSKTRQALSSECWRGATSASSSSGWPRSLRCSRDGLRRVNGVLGGETCDIRLFRPRSLTLKGVAMSRWLRQPLHHRRADASRAAACARASAVRSRRTLRSVTDHGGARARRSSRTGWRRPHRSLKR
jgi:hypothetical protein